MAEQTDRPEIAPPVREDLPFIERHGISPPAFAAISLFIIFLIYQGIGGVISYLLFGLTPSVENAGLLRFVTGAGEVLFIAVPTLFLIRLATRSSSDFLRLRIPSAGVLLLPLIGIISLQQMLQVYLVFQDRIPLPPDVQNLVRQLQDMIEQMTNLLAGAATPRELGAVLLVIGLIPAVCEELLFRGLVMRSLERTLGPLSAIVLTGVIFAAYHLNPFTFVPLAVLGAYLGFLAVRSGSIWTSVAAHFYNNAYACISLYYTKSDSFIPGGDPEKMSTGTLLLIFWFFGVILILSSIYFLRITAHPVEQDHIGTGA